MLTNLSERRNLRACASGVGIPDPSTGGDANRRSSRDGGTRFADIPDSLKVSPSVLAVAPLDSSSQFGAGLAFSSLSPGSASRQGAFVVSPRAADAPEEPDDDAQEDFDEEDFDYEFDDDFEEEYEDEYEFGEDADPPVIEGDDDGEIDPDLVEFDDEGGPAIEEPDDPA